MRVGFVGTGAMGQPMAANLARAGFAPIVCDRQSERVAALAALGGRRGSCPREVAAASDVVMVMVADEAEVSVVVDGPDGVLAGAAPGLILIIHSTISPGFCRALAERLAAAGIEVVDAPVSGAPVRAEEGSLSLFVGASSETVARLMPILRAVGQKIFHMGPVGAGQTVKIVNNLVAIGNIGVINEGLALAAGLGLDQDKMLEVINGSSGQSFSSTHYVANRAGVMERMRRGGKGWQMAAKDLDLALKLGRESATALPVTGLVSQLLERIYPKLDDPA